MAGSWRIVVISSVQPISAHLIPLLRARHGHDVVAQLAPRLEAAREGPSGVTPLTDATVPGGLDLLFARDRLSIEPLLRAYAPDLVLCWGFPWKIPRTALDVPRLGSVNLHPALLPRHRGPIPLAWALRAGDADFGVTWHRMDAELDTGNLLAQAVVPIADDDVDISRIGPRLQEAAFALLPAVFERLAAGDPGDPQSDEGASWAGHFADDGYALVDWARPARAIHDQVRAWHLTFGLSGIVAPVAELDGERVRLLRTSLADPGDEARRVECADGPLWIVAYERL